MHRHKLRPSLAARMALSIARDRAVPVRSALTASMLSSNNSKIHLLKGEVRRPATRSALPASVPSNSKLLARPKLKLRLPQPQPQPQPQLRPMAELVIAAVGHYKMRCKPSSSRSGARMLRDHSSRL